MDVRDELTDLNEVTPDPAVKVRASRKITAVVFFLISLIVVFLTANYLFHFFEIPIRRLPAWKILLRLPFIEVLRSGSVSSQPVVSYLSAGVKDWVQKDILIILQQKGKELSHIEGELKRLEGERTTFFESMEKRKDIFRESVSIIDDEEGREHLESAVQLQKYELRFDNEAGRRIEKYQKLYDQKKKRLSSQKEEITRDLAELNRYMQSLEEGKGLEALPSEGSLFITRGERKLMARFIFYLDRGDYERALKVYQEMKPSSPEPSKVDIVKELLLSAQDYKEKLSAYERSTLLDDIKMSYLEENYQKTASHLDGSDYLGPLLGDLRNVLYRNIEVKEQINEEIELKRKLKTLKRKAAELEKQGEHGKALKIYEDLLILNLPSYDREFLILRIHSLMGNAVKNEMKRADNTRAIKYLDTARDLYREGRENEAYKVYQQIITECANSDYISEALTAMKEIASR